LALGKPIWPDAAMNLSGIGLSICRLLSSPQVPLRNEETI